MLLVDDSHEDLFFVKRLLSRAGIAHPVVTVDGGEEAIVFLRACIQPGGVPLTPLLVFCDIKMPGRDGFEVLEWTRKQGRFRKLPFYMLSGSDLDADKSRAEKLGATGYVVKFPPAETLRDAVASAEKAR